MPDFDIDEYSQNLPRVCETCGRPYSIGQYLETAEHYFGRPHSYRLACEKSCLDCWLCVGPTDFPEEGGLEEPNPPPDAPGELPAVPLVGTEEEWWPYEEIYEELMQGDVLHGFRWFFDRGANLAILPITRMFVERPTFFPAAVAIYPPGTIDLGSLRVIPNREDSGSLAEHLSYLSGVTRDVLESHPLVVFPCRFDWSDFHSSSHKAHVHFLRSLSEEVDRHCLNFVRYRLCPMEPIDHLPGHAGQVYSNSMMAGGLFYNPSEYESYLIGGAVFTHSLTRGIGLELTQLEWDEFPADGEVGSIANHAIGLYASLLEASTPTFRFIQAMGLLEFLAFPDDPFKHHNFKDEVKQVIARYVATNQRQYNALLDRFHALTGKKDSEGRIVGIRTRVVHKGERIETAVPDARDRQELFRELDGYLRVVIDHMIAHSEMSLEEYLDFRQATLRPFEK